MNNTQPSLFPVSYEDGIDYENSSNVDQIRGVVPGQKIAPQGIIVINCKLDTSIPEETIENRDPNSNKVYAPRTTNPNDYIAVRGDIVYTYIDGPGVASRLPSSSHSIPDGLVVFSSLNGRSIYRPIRVVGVIDFAGNNENTLNHDDMVVVRIFGPVTVINQSRLELRPGQGVYASPSPTVCILNGIKRPGIIAKGQPDDKYVASTISISAHGLTSDFEEYEMKILEESKKYENNPIGFLRNLTSFLRGPTMRVIEDQAWDHYCIAYAHRIMLDEYPQFPEVHVEAVKCLENASEERQMICTRYQESIQSPSFDYDTYLHPYDNDVAIDKDQDVLSCSQTENISLRLSKKIANVRNHLTKEMEDSKDDHRNFMQRFYLGSCLSISDKGHQLDILLGGVPHI
jgi:hypothetical protein